MIGWLTTTVQLLALGMAALFLIITLRKHPVVRWHLYAMAVLEAFVLAAAVVSIVNLFTMAASDEMIMFIGYLSTVVLVLPVAGIWGLYDRSHWGTAIIAGSCAVVAVLLLRMEQVWRLMNMT